MLPWTSTLDITNEALTVSLQNCSKCRSGLAIIFIILNAERAAGIKSETFDCHAFKRDRQEECVQTSAKIARSDPRPSSGCSRRWLGTHTSRQSCSEVGKARDSHEFGSYPAISICYEGSEQTRDQPTIPLLWFTSCRRWWRLRSQLRDQLQILLEHLLWDGDLGHLNGDIASVVHYLRAKSGLRGAQSQRRWEYHDDRSHSPDRQFPRVRTYHLAPVVAIAPQ